MEELDVYKKCKQLSQLGDWDSLNELMSIYLSATDSQTKKDARKALRKSKNRKAVMLIIHNAIESASTDEMLLDLLFTGQLIYRAKFLYDYLIELYRVYGKVPNRTISEMVELRPFSSDEMDILVQYIIDNDDYNMTIYRNLDSIHQEAIIEHLLSLGYINEKMLSLFSENDILSSNIQTYLKNYLTENPEQYPKILPHIVINSNNEKEYFENRDNLFYIYKALLRNKGDISKLISNDINIRVSKAVINGIKLNDEQLQYVKNQVNKAITIKTDINTLDISFHLFFKNLVKVNPVYTERIYTTLYEKTGLYSNSILHQMTEMGMPYAYRILTNRLISVNNEEIRRKTIYKLFKYFSKNIEDTYEHIIQLEDENLLDYSLKTAKRLGLEIRTKTNTLFSILGDQSYCLLDHSIIVSELLTRIAKEIKATQFYSAVGFAYTSGLKMLKPVLDEVISNNGYNELIVGSLQTYGISEKNNKIDKSTVVFLNNLINENQIQLYTYQNSFYHGKYYYLSNDEVAFIVMGSSNISKTAYLSNYELDSLFKVSKGTPEDDNFLNWYKNFSYDCLWIEQIDETKFDSFEWNVESQAFGNNNVKHITHNEIVQRIDKLTDVETKFRLNLWLSYEPTEILSNFEIPALDDYVAFLFPNNAIAVFESFVMGNAYYIFHYDNFDNLLSQLRKLSKKEMILFSDFLIRGYHIKDQDKIENKIEKLFKDINL